MKMRKAIIIIAIVAFAGVIAAQAIAPPPPAPPKYHRKPLKFHRGDWSFGMNINAIRKLAKEIGLTEEQLKKIREIRRDAQKDMVDLNADLQKSIIDLKEIASDPKATRVQIEGAAKKVLEKGDALKLRRLRMFLDVRDVLTPEQREKLMELISRPRMMSPKSSK